MDALIEADTAIALNVAESDWFLLRAYVQFQLENYDATVTDMAHIEHQEMSSPYFHELYGYALFMYDEYEEAAEQFDRAMSLDGMSYGVMYGRAMVTLENEDYEAAEEEINQLLEHPDVDEYAYLLQSQIYDVDDEIGKALESVGRALEINPDFYEAIQWRAYYYSQNDEIEKSMQDIDRAIKMKPDDWYNYNQRGDNNYYRGEFRKAIPDYTIYYENTKEPWVLFNRGYCFHMTLEYDKAIADYTEYIVYYPNYEEVYRMRADSYIAKGEIVKAGKDILKMAELQSGGEIFGEDDLRTLIYSMAFMLIMGVVGLGVLLWFLLKKNKPMKHSKTAMRPPPLPPTGA